jgi:phosphonate transport system ATP-binding protein
MMFQFINVTHRFDQITTLQNLNFTIQSGERVAIVGSSGAGKSTLLKLCNVTLQPTQGEIMAFDRALTRLDAKTRRQIQRQIGMIYQQFHLVDNLRVIHNVNAGHLGRWPLWRSLVSLLVPLQRSTALAALTQVGIPEKIDERTDQLSGGQQQRVAIARVLVQNPFVILADEPTASLDPELSKEVMALLCRLCEEQGRTLIVSLHDVELARQYCDRMIGLKSGQLVFDLPSQAVTQEVLDALYQIQSAMV